MRFEKSDKRRYLAVLEGRIPDRVPLHETIFNRRYIRHATGLDAYDSIHVMPAVDYVRMCQQVGLDMVTAGYFFRFEGFNTWEIVERQEFPSFTPFLNRVDALLEAIKGSQTGLMVYVHGPLDSTYLSMGYMGFFFATKDDPALVEAVMDRYTQHHLELIRELVKRPIDLIQIADDVCMSTGPFIRPGQFKAWWIPRVQKLLDPIIAAGIPYIFHSDGKIDHFMDIIIDLGFMANNPIEPACNDIAQVKKRYGDRITLMGNLDIGGVLASGTQEEVRVEVNQLLKVMMPGGRYIAMSSSSISDAVIPENYDAMVEAVIESGKY